jgi:hypothetical protein
MKRLFAHALVVPTDLHGDWASKDGYTTMLKRFATKPVPSTSVPAHNPVALPGLHFSPPALRDQVLERLNTLEASLPLDESQTGESLAFVFDLLTQETSPAITTKAVSLLGPLCMHPFVDPNPLISDILGSSHFKDVLVSNQALLPAVLKTITAILTSKSGSVVALEKLAQSALIGLPTPSCRTQALLTLAKLDTEWPNSPTNKLLFHYLADSDFRVRSAAFRFVRQWILKHCASTLSESINTMETDVSPLHELTLELYKQSVFALTDNSDDVQLEALRNIWFLANLQPEKLADDAFRKLCNMVSDASVRVRSSACGLLGTLHGVTPKLLLQSLSKSLLKVGASSADGKATWKEDPFDPGAGQDSVEVVSKLSTQSRLLESGANGAFVHGLEDEFKEVRDAALSSMCELAHGSKVFALKSTEYFVDMFNDEIDAVRVHALQSVSKIGQLIFLSEDQLLVVLAMLDDATFTVRLSTRKMLTAIRLMDAKSLLTAVNVFQATLSKYFTERDTILPTFAALGKNHPHFVELLFEELFKIDTRFVLREPRLDTISYVSIAILLLNAAKENANLIEWLPPFIHRHYLYLKRHYPLLVPDVPSLDSATHSSHEGKHLAQSSTLKAQQITERVLSGSSTPHSNSFVWSSSSSSPNAPGFSEGNPLANYNPSALLFGLETKMGPDTSAYLDSILARLEAALLSLPASKSIDDKFLNDFGLLLASLKRDLNTNCEFKFGSTQKEFYLSYLEILEAFFSPLLLSDLSLRRSCGQRILYMKFMFVGLPLSMSKLLDHIALLWSDISSATEPSLKFESIFIIWDALRTPMRVNHMLKRVKAVFLFPSSDPSSIREFPASLPLSIQVAADMMTDSLSDLVLIISCDAVHLKMRVPLSSSHFTKLRPLRYSINVNASIPPQKWEHNKLAHLRLSICRSGTNQPDIDVSDPISIPIRSKFR